MGSSKNDYSKNDYSKNDYKKDINMRYAAFDLLRVIAAFSVIMLHCAAQFWYELPVTSSEWKIANAYDACFRFGVPIFVMMSGALFLSREKKPEIKRLYRHNILRLFVCYFLWNSVYGLYDCYLFGFENLTLRQVLKEMLSGRYHLWFLPMLAGLYMLCPILYDMVRNVQQNILRYFLWLFFGLQILRCSVIPYIHNNEILHILSLFEIPMVCGYVGYFILGYYLMKYELPTGIKKTVNIGFFPSVIYNIVASTWVSVSAENPKGEVYDCFCLGTFLIVVKVFLFCKSLQGEQPVKKQIAQEQVAQEQVASKQFDTVSVEVASKSFLQKKAGIWKELSANTFGIYLLHLGFLEIMKGLGLHVMSLPIWIGIPVMAVLTYIVCNCLAAVLRRIPVIGRWIC